MRAESAPWRDARRCGACLPRSSRRSRTAPSRELANSGSVARGGRTEEGQAGSRRDRSPRGLPSIRLAPRIEARTAIACRITSRRLHSRPVRCRGGGRLFQQDANEIAVGGLRESRIRETSERDEDSADATIACSRGADRTRRRGARFGCQPPRLLRQRLVALAATARAHGVRWHPSPR